MSGSRENASSGFDKRSPLPSYKINSNNNGTPELDSGRKSVILYSGKKQKNFQRGRALLRSRKYLDANVNSSDDDSDTAPKMMSKSGSVCGLAVTPEKKVDEKNVAGIDNALFSRALKKSGDDVAIGVKIGVRLGDEEKWGKGTDQFDILSGELHGVDSVDALINKRISGSSTNNSPTDKSGRNKNKNYNDFQDKENRDIEQHNDSSNEVLINSFQTPNPKKNHKSNKRNSLTRTKEEPFSDFKTVSPFSDFLSPSIREGFDSPCSYSNINDIIYPNIHTDSTLNTYYSKIEKNELSRKYGKKEEEKRNRNDHTPRGRNNLTVKNIANGGLSGGFRYIKRPNWVPGNRLLSPKKGEYSRNYDIDEEMNNALSDDENENKIESEKVFLKFARSFSPTNENPYFETESVEMNLDKTLCEISAPINAAITVNEIDDSSILEKEKSGGRMKNGNDADEIQNNMRTKMQMKESVSVISSDLKSRARMESVQLSPKSMKKIKHPPTTPRQPPITPGHSGPITPGRSPFAQSLAIGSLSPRTSKTPNSKKKTSTAVADRGNDEKTLLSKSPILRRPSFSSIKFSPNSTIKKRYNMSNYNINSEEHKRQQTISSNEIITESIFNALFLIEQKNSKISGAVPRIRCWDDDSDSEEEEDEILYNGKNMNTAIENFTNFLSRKSCNENADSEETANSETNSDNDFFPREKFHLFIIDTIHKIKENTTMRSKFKEKISAVDSSWFKNLILTNLLRPEPVKIEYIPLRKIRSKSRGSFSTENMSIRKKSSADLSVKEEKINQINPNLKKTEFKNTDFQDICTNGNDGKPNDGVKNRAKSISPNKEHSFLPDKDFVKIENCENRIGSFDEIQSEKTNLKNIEQGKKNVKSNSEGEINKFKISPIITKKKTDSLGDIKLCAKIRIKTPEKRSRSFSITEDPGNTVPPFISNLNSEANKNVNLKDSPVSSDLSSSLNINLNNKVVGRKSRGDSFCDEITMLDNFPVLQYSPEKESEKKISNKKSENENIDKNKNKQCTEEISSKTDHAIDEKENEKEHEINPSPLFKDFFPPSKSDILSKYITTSFVIHLISELNFEDDRFLSPRVTVLTSLYKMCDTLQSRLSIVNAVLNCTSERFERCARVSSFSYKSEFDTNLLASRGLLGIHLNDQKNNSNSNNNDNDSNHNLIHSKSSDNINNKNTNTLFNKYFDNNINTHVDNAMTSSCDILSSKIETKERSPITHRDHEGSIMETVLFITSSVVNDLLNFIHQYSTVLCVDTYNNDDNGGNNGDNNNDERRNKINNNEAHSCYDDSVNYRYSVFDSTNSSDSKNKFGTKIINNFNNSNNKNKRQEIVEENKQKEDMKNALLKLMDIQHICWVIQKCLFNILRCYASPLGRKGDHPEQPILLKSVFDCLNSVHQVYTVISYLSSNYSPTKSSNSSTNFISRADHGETNRSVICHPENREIENYSGMKGKRGLHQNTVFVEDSLRSLLRIWNYNVENDSTCENMNRTKNDEMQCCNGNRDYEESNVLNDNECKNKNESNDDKNEDGGRRNNDSDKNYKNNKNRCCNKNNNPINSDNNNRINNSINNNINNNNSNSVKTNASTGGNHVRDLAFVQTAEIILNQIQNLEIMFIENQQKSVSNDYENCGNHGFLSSNFNHNCNSESINHGMKSDTKNKMENTHVNQKGKIENCEMNKIPDHISFNLIPSSIFSRPVKFRVLVERVLQKILTGMLSYHCKIACMCLAMVEKKEILMKYFVTITEDNCGNNSDDENEFDEYSSESVEHESKNSREIDRISSKLSDWKQTQLDKLVEVLRKNRNHWHPSVKSASGQLFDKLLNYLE